MIEPQVERRGSVLGENVHCNPVNEQKTGKFRAVVNRVHSLWEDRACTEKYYASVQLFDLATREMKYAVLRCPAYYIKNSVLIFRNEEQKLRVLPSCAATSRKGCMTQIANSHNCYGSTFSSIACSNKFGFPPFRRGRSMLLKISVLVPRSRVPSLYGKWQPNLFRLHI